MGDPFTAPETAIQRAVPHDGVRLAKLPLNAGVIEPAESRGEVAAKVGFGLAGHWLLSQPKGAIPLGQ